MIGKHLFIEYVFGRHFVVPLICSIARLIKHPISIKCCYKVPYWHELTVFFVFLHVLSKHFKMSFYSRDVWYVDGSGPDACNGFWSRLHWRWRNTSLRNSQMSSWSVITWLKCQISRPILSSKIAYFGHRQRTRCYGISSPKAVSKWRISNCILNLQRWNTTPLCRGTREDQWRPRVSIDSTKKDCDWNIYQ